MKHYPHHVEDFEVATRISDLPMVYIITTHDFGFIKVGKSTNFKSRLSNIQSGCPYELSLWCSIRTPKADQVEAFLHERLEHCRARGEWFSPSPEDLDDLIDFCAFTNREVKKVHRALLQA